MFIRRRIGSRIAQETVALQTAVTSVLAGKPKMLDNLLKKYRNGE